jgi:RNA polymerase primary sigma factor
MGQETIVTEKKITGRKTTKLRELSVSEKEKIYQQHLGLVVSIAKKYIGRSPGFTFGDLIDEGFLGLFRAAEKFDKQKGCRFSTYATWWIRQSITRALSGHGRTIRIPAYIIEASRKYRKVRQKLSQELEREPLIEEIAAAMEITIDRVQQIRKFLENPSEIFSLERPPEEDENSILSELIEDIRVISPVESASRNILKEDLEKTLKSLTSREEKIIKMRFGLEGIEYTLQEIADEMGLSRERIRQIIKKALARLRRNEVTVT